MPAQGFVYTDASDVTGAQWVEDSSWPLPPTLVKTEEEYEGTTKGVRFGDVDGDGRIDAVRAFKAEGKNRHQVFLNDGTDWVEDPTWSAALAALEFQDRDVRLWVPDIEEPHECSPNPDEDWVTRQVYFDRHDDNVLAETWETRIGKTGRGRLVDIDGDGRADIVISQRMGKHRCGYGSNHNDANTQTDLIQAVFLNTGSGWEKHDALSDLPTYFSIHSLERAGNAISDCAKQRTFQASSAGCDDDTLHLFRYNFPIGTRLVDLNGDGRLDLVTKTDGTFQTIYDYLENSDPEGAWLNTSAGWVDVSGQYTPPIKLMRKASGLSSDVGARFVDLNGDGLTDLVKGRVPIHPDLASSDGNLNVSAMESEGIWLNTGEGWCDHVTCPDAARYLLPVDLGRSFSTSSNTPKIARFEHYVADNGVRFEDLNGDGLIDIVVADQIDGVYTAYLHDPAAQPTVWVEAPELAPPADPLYSFTLQGDKNNDVFVADNGVRLLDVDGNGTADFVRTYEDGTNYIALSERTIADRLAVYDNGRGGTVELTWDTPQRLRDAILDGLAQADLDATPGDDDGAERWPKAPVIATRKTIDVNGDSFEWAYTYAHARWCPGHRAGLGFRAVEVTDPTGTVARSFFYQAHGRTGQASLREILAGGQRLSVSASEWEVLDGSLVPGSATGVHVGRPKSTSEVLEYAGQEGAKRTTSYAYDDTYGFNFIGTLTITRPTGTLTVSRTPQSAPGAWIHGLVDTETHTSGAGALLRSIDRDWDDQGHLTRIARLIAPRGGTQTGTQVTQWEFDGTYGNVIKRTDPNGNEEYFCYDGDTSLGPDACPTATDSSFATLRASRDKLGAMTSFISDRTGRPTQVTRFNGDVVDFSIDAFYRTTAVHVTPVGAAQAIAVEARSYEDTTVGTPIEQREFTTAGDETEYVWGRTFFDGFGRVERTVRPGPNGNTIGELPRHDHAGRPVLRTFDQDCGADLNCAALTTQVDAVESFLYDPLGRILRHDTPNGTRVADYRHENRAQPTGPGAGSPLNDFDGVLLKDANGNLVQRIFDGERLVWVDECTNQVLPSTTDLSSGVCTSPAETFYTFEATGEVARAYDAAAKGVGDLDPVGYEDSSHYLEYSYDTLGRILAIRDPDAGLTQHNYDDNGNLEAVTNARGQTTTFEFDALDRLNAVHRPSFMVGTKEFRATTSSIVYDDTQTRRRLYEVDRFDDTPHAHRYRIDYEYDSLGRESRRTLDALGTSLLLDTESDLLGRVTQLWYPTGSRVSYRYEGAYLSQVCFGENCSSAAFDFVEGVAYDALGRPITEQFAAGELAYDYFPDSDVDARRLRNLAFTRTADSTKHFDLTYGYDRNGNVASVSDTRDGLEDLVDATAVYSYDHLNRLKGRQLGSVWKYYTYDPLGNLTGKRLDSPTASPNQTYGEATRPHAVTVGATDKTYDYDDDGNVVRRDGQYLTYDSTNRLLCVGEDATGDPCADVEFSYTVDGERVVARRPTATRFYLGEAFEWEPGTGQINVYAFGRRVAERIEGGASRREAWMPAAFPLPGSPRVWGLAALSGLGFVLLILLQTSGSLPRARRQPLGTVIGLLVISGILAQPGLALAGGGPSNVNRWLVSDHLGSSSLVLSGVGDVVHRRVFQPFGEIFRESETTETTSQLYTGQRFESDIGLYDFKARWYDPETGRFQGVDPIVQEVGDPQTLNPYSYVRNNPTNLTDPDGFGFFEKLLGFFMIAVGIIVAFGNPAAGAALMLTGASVLTTEYGGPPELALAFGALGLWYGAISFAQALPGLIKGLGSMAQGMAAALSGNGGAVAATATTGAGIEGAVSMTAPLVAAQASANVADRIDDYEESQTEEEPTAGSYVLTGSDPKHDWKDPHQALEGEMVDGARERAREIASTKLTKVQEEHMHLRETHDVYGYVLIRGMKVPSRFRLGEVHYIPRTIEVTPIVQPRGWPKPKGAMLIPKETEAYRYMHWDIVPLIRHGLPMRVPK